MLCVHVFFMFIGRIIETITICQNLDKVSSMLYNLFIIYITLSRNNVQKDIFLRKSIFIYSRHVTSFFWMFEYRLCLTTL